MKARNEQITQYISKSADFAKPILHELREIVHDFCPDTEEAMKWSMPFFMYRGKILCSFASFKNHCSFGFWLHSEMSDPHGIFKRSLEGGMGSLGKITSLEDLPETEHLGAYILEAMALIEQGTIPRELNPKFKKPVGEIPEELTALLDVNPKAKAAFESFPPSYQREYINWITEAKREETKQRRLQQTIENLQEGKSKDWKYMR
ncbi:YdeI family protein [uncultured Fluviicola sp.]|uniref:YdeI/OmpD-associated family protein n=1 Tax=uncultured Fluviicola sp. TaxID=463303 RepID=UPI0025F0ED13|nr:YdeI/OmpD-associated family protein [uncultured Fluviicola sp.]